MKGDTDGKLHNKASIELRRACERHNTLKTPLVFHDKVCATCLVPIRANKMAKIWLMAFEPTRAEGSIAWKGYVFVWSNAGWVSLLRLAFDPEQLSEMLDHIFDALEYWATMD